MHGRDRSELTLVSRPNGGDARGREYLG